MKLYSINTGYFKLDGGAMFGVVPKSIWNKLNPADENNMCSWALRCLLIEDEGRLILIDNVLWYGRVADPAMDKDKRTQAIKQINQQIYHDDRVQISLIPIGDGLTIARKK